MSNYPKLTITHSGHDMIAEAEAEQKPLIFTRVKIGAGQLAPGQNSETLTEVIDEKMTLPLNSGQKLNTGGAKLRFVLDNSALETGFFAREIAVYAKVGESGRERLYAYTNGGNYVDYVPDKTNPIDAQIIDVYLVTGNAANVQIEVSSSAYATIYDVADAIAAHNIAPDAHENRFAEVRALIEEHGGDPSAHAELFDDVYREITSHNNSPNAHLALFAQIRQSLTAHNAAPDAHSDIRQLCENAGVNLLRRSQAYSIGDIAYSKNLPSWARLECVRAGTTAASEPGGLAATSAGALVTDGGVLWIVDDVRDGTPVGSVRGSLYLPPGYVKANGATVQRADYPRLVSLANRYNLWTDNPWGYPGLFGRGNGSSTFILPNWTDRMAQFTAYSPGAALAAGLPNITGTFVADGFGAKEGQDSGAFTSVYQRYSYTSSDTNAGVYKYTFDASRSNAIYGASNTVRPPAIKVMPIIRY